MLAKGFFEQHSRVAVDIDDTLSGTTELVLKNIKKDKTLLGWEYLENIVLQNDKHLPISSAEKLKLWEYIWSSSSSPINAKPLKGSQEGMQKILENSEEVFLLTARDDISEIKKSGTLDWVEKYFPQISEKNILFASHLTKNEIPKGQLCKKHGITVLIDDNINNAIDVVENGVSCILLEKSWNCQENFSHPLLHRVKNWQEIINSFYE